MENKENKEKKEKIVSFFRRKSYAFSALLMLVAVLGMSGVYMAQQRNERRYAEFEAERAQELLWGDEGFAWDDGQELQSVEQIIRPNVIEEREEDAEETAVEEQESPEADDEAQEEAAKEETVAEVRPALRFSADSELGWPLNGNVILNYSMDQTVYFATLDQYKLNPALIIQAEVNDQVRSVASGMVSNIENDDVTGTTMSVDLGDGYCAVYGQLKELAFDAGDYLNAGDVIGYVSEPTKYFSIEGPNLYFQLIRDNRSVDPMEYLQ